MIPLPGSPGFGQYAIGHGPTGRSKYSLGSAHRGATRARIWTRGRTNPKKHSSHRCSSRRRLWRSARRHSCRQSFIKLVGILHRRVDPVEFTKETGSRSSMTRTQRTARYLAFSPGKTGYDAVVPPGNSPRPSDPTGVFTSTSKLRRTPGTCGWWCTDILAKYDPGNKHSVNYMWARPASAITSPRSAKFTRRCFAPRA